MKVLIAFVQLVLSLFCLFLIYLAWMIIDSSPFMPGFYQGCPDGSVFDPSWQRMVPLYIIGMLLLFCGLVVIRLPRVYQEEQYGLTIPIQDEDAPLTKRLWFLRLLPPVEHRDERYLWTFALIALLITLILRDQSLNWILSNWGYRTSYTYTCDAISLICAPLSGVVLTLQFLAWRRSLKARRLQRS